MTRKPDEIRNVEASVRQRLFNLSKEQKRDFQSVLKLYFLERFLYRLSRPVVAYARRLGSSGPPTVFVAHCSTPTCSSATVASATFDPALGGPLNVEGSPSITIGRDGLPLIAFQSMGQLRVLHCANVFCVPYVRAR